MEPRLPERKHPSHGGLETWGKPTIVLVTICTRNRTKWLDDQAAHQLLVSVWKESRQWLVGRYVVMPDHIHLFAARGTDVSLERWIKHWKAAFSKRHGNPQHRWQAHHWDRRLRSGESYREKWEYVRANPVRQGLVDDPDDWPYQGEVHSLHW